jgi:hypothetical protein
LSGETSSLADLSSKHAGTLWEVKFHTSFE